MNTVFAILFNPGSDEFRSFFGFEATKDGKNLELYPAFLVLVFALDGAVLKVLYSALSAIVLGVLIVYDHSMFRIGCIDHTLGKEAEAFCAFDWFMHGPNQIVLAVFVYFVVTAIVTYYYFRNARYLAPGTEIPSVLSLLWTLHVLVLSLTPVMAFVYFKIEDGVHVFLPTKIFALVSVVLYGAVSLVPVFTSNGKLLPLVIAGHFVFGVAPVSFWEGRYMYRPKEKIDNEFHLAAKVCFDFALTSLFAIAVHCVWSLWSAMVQSRINLWNQAEPDKDENDVKDDVENDTN
jgi:hypothetical protein